MHSSLLHLVLLQLLVSGISSCSTPAECQLEALEALSQAKDLYTILGENDSSTKIEELERKVSALEEESTTLKAELKQLEDTNYGDFKPFEGRINKIDYVLNEDNSKQNLNLDYDERDYKAILLNLCIDILHESSRRFEVSLCYLNKEMDKICLPFYFKEDTKLYNSNNYIWLPTRYIHQAYVKSSNFNGIRNRMSAYVIGYK
eukprot:CAMPEP_0170519216 /NCGR_PEP_ID=MMETSP0209-20121228/4716_1 /TAXON_ID=665100 ORGANISM="Litonotus pictus, Strain P1" /NCGR_SAMPLE_ID=MMETSP0209 /ASSEMBLY_ACC=CAM_ASM_000301 /LENGTH=202 /DNA_ID=CAMNT_0010805049 /DNA_START=1 /DNA_END=609 /DNA_ORIENTATION=+